MISPLTHERALRALPTARRLIAPLTRARLLRALEELHATGTLTPALEASLRASNLAALRAAPTAGRPYGRVPLEHGARGEVMLATWQPGVRCAPHDHGGTQGRVLVLAGRFEERRFALDGPALGVPSQVRRWQAGESIEVARDVVHDMESADAVGLTLHLYPGDAGPARLYDAEARCTYLARGGAWLPPDDVVQREPWTRP
ncbi:MAG TPA: cysteine dioxygenase family protein [Polyangiaceae bacterium]|nr:cysteine dioxygenase family protein [Polyangiaceae bacterium]